MGRPGTSPHVWRRVTQVRAPRATSCARAGAQGHRGCDACAGRQCSKPRAQPLTIPFPLVCLPAEFKEVGSGSAASLTACTCGYITNLDLGLVTVGGTQYVATVGFTCSSGQGVVDPAAGSLTLTGSLTTGQCTTGGCSSLAVETSQVASLLGMVGMQGTGECGSWP